MKQKTSVLWRVAAVLVALTVLTASLVFSSTQAKYAEALGTKGTFEYFHFLTLQGEGTMSDAPAGKYAFYAKGDNGGSNGTSKGGLGATCYGIYTKDANGSFTSGSIPGGFNGGDGAGGNGGAGRYILEDLTSPPGNPGNSGSNTPTAAQTAALRYIVTVAGGGGGAGRNANDYHGGNAGGYTTSGRAAAVGGILDGPWGSSTGIAGAWQGSYENGQSQTTNRNSSSGGGGDGRQWNWFNNAEQGNDAGGATNGATVGSWFSAGRGTTNGSYSTGGGGGGIWGGGGGSSRVRVLSGGGGSGGGGASYVNTVRGAAVATAPTDLYAAEAMAYFWSLTASNNIVLVWLGPT